MKNDDKLSFDLLLNKAEQMTGQELETTLDDFSDEELGELLDGFLDSHNDIMADVKETKQKAINLLNQKSKQK